MHTKRKEFLKDVAKNLITDNSMEPQISDQ